MTLFHRQHRLLLPLLLLWTWLGAIEPAEAQLQASSRPRLVVLLCDALRWEDVRNPAYPHLVQWTESGAVGLMNTAVGGTKSPTAAALALAAGHYARSEPSDELAEQTALQTFRHAGFDSLKARSLGESLFGYALSQAKPPLSCAVFGNTDAQTHQRRATLWGVDAKGEGNGSFKVTRPDPKAPFGQRDHPLLLAQQALRAESAVVVLQLGDTARAETARSRLAPKDYEAARAAALRRLNILVHLLLSQLDPRETSVLLLSPYPPSASSHTPNLWNHLTPILAWGKSFPAGLLTSPTTRTRGLIANIDVAPTLLSLLNAPIPTLMTGRKMRVETEASAEPRLAHLARQDYLTTLNDQTMRSAMPFLIAFCALWVLGGVWCYRRNPKAVRWASPGLVFVLNAGTACLFAPLLPPPTVLEYALRIMGWMLGLTGFCYAVGRSSRLAPPLVAVFLTLFSLWLDIWTGQNLLKDSLISAYPLSGIRYYGIGNEYLGIVLGFALIGGFWGVETGGKWKRGAVLTFWVLLTLSTGFPRLGANAGSLITGCVGFGAGAAYLWGRRPTLSYIALCVAIGLSLAFGLSALEARLFPQDASHIGAVLQSAQSGKGYAYLLEIALRKVLMNLSLLVSPWFLLALTVMGGVLWAMKRLMGEELRALLAHSPRLEEGLRCLLIAGGVSLLFKDSGVITALFLCGSAIPLYLWRLWNSPYTSELPCE